MGCDKSLLTYHNSSQRDHLWALLENAQVPAWLSLNSSQTDVHRPTLIDLHADIGPMGGLLSAFAHRPEVAWLVLACDMPSVGEDTLNLLLEQRQSHQLGTFFKAPDSPFIEPLLGIYEPAIYPILLENFIQKRYGLQVILQENSVHLLPMVSDFLANVNTPGDRARYLSTHVNNTR
jgi:molybdenum cofactor guanylyltransferase